MECGGNGGGMMELHHITGRDSSATTNGAPVCTQCHAGMVHTQDEEQRLTARVLQALLAMKYQLDEKDEVHFREHPHLIVKNKYLAI
jgi:hypothetical protein